MPTQIEARRLSGVDLGKTITLEDRIDNSEYTGTLVSVDHRLDSDGKPHYVALQITDLVPPRNQWPDQLYLHHTDTLTITGRPS